MTHANRGRIPKSVGERIFCLVPYLLLAASIAGLVVALYAAYWIGVATFLVTGATSVLQIRQVRSMGW